MHQHCLVRCLGLWIPSEQSGMYTKQMTLAAPIASDVEYCQDQYPCTTLSLTTRSTTTNATQGGKGGYDAHGQQLEAELTIMSIIVICFLIHIPVSDLHEALVSAGLHCKRSCNECSVLCQLTSEPTPVLNQESQQGGGCHDS